MKEESIEKLAKQLGTTTEYLWSVLVKQAPISAIVEIILPIIVYGVLFIMYKVGKAIYNPDKGNFWDDNVLAPLTIVGIVIFFATIFFTCTGIGNMITALANPEYWALKKILDTIK